MTYSTSKMEIVKYEVRERATKQQMKKQNKKTSHTLGSGESQGSRDMFIDESNPANDDDFTRP